MSPTDDEPERRGSRIPLPDDHWWRFRVRQAMSKFAADRKLSRPPGWVELYAELTRRGVETSVDAVRRCVEGRHITWELAVPISVVLGIPPPAVISDDQDHAFAIWNVEEIKGLLGQLRSLQSRVIDSTPPDGAASDDGVERIKRDRSGR